MKFVKLVKQGWDIHQGAIELNLTWNNQETFSLVSPVFPLSSSLDYWISHVCAQQIDRPLPPQQIETGDTSTAIPILGKSH